MAMQVEENNPPQNLLAVLPIQNPTNAMRYISHSKYFQSSPLPLHSSFHLVPLIVPTMLRPLIPLNKRKYPQNHTHPINSNLSNMNNYPQIPQQVFHHPRVVATQLVHPLHQPQLWIELGLREQEAIFTMDINGENVMIIIENPNFPSQLIIKGMKMSMDNYMNHQWMKNVLNLLAPVIAPTRFHNVQLYWNLPHHFNPHVNPNHVHHLPFYTSQEAIDAKPPLLSMGPNSSPEPGSSDANRLSPPPTRFG